MICSTTISIRAIARRKTSGLLLLLVWTNASLTEPLNLIFSEHLLHLSQADICIGESQVLPREVLLYSSTINDFEKNFIP